MKIDFKNDFPMTEERFNSLWEKYDEVTICNPNIFAEGDSAIIPASYFMYVYHIGYDQFNGHVFDNCEDLKDSYKDKKYEQEKAEDHSMLLLAEQIGETITDDEILAAEYWKLMGELEEKLKGVPA